MVETQEEVLGGPLAALIAGLVVEPGEDRVTVGDRIVEASDSTTLHSELSTALYDLWHAGSVGRDGGGRSLPRRDPGFERELTAAMPHRRTVVPATVRALPGDDDPERGVAEVNRVRVLVPARELAGRTPGDTVLLDMPAEQPALSPGFFFVSGAAGGAGGGAVLRLYVHLASAAYAPAAWRTALEVLEGRGARYRAKVLGRPERYPRRDAMVVYLPDSSWRYVPDLVRALDGAAGLGDATSGLAHRIGPGLAMAWEPADGRPGWRRRSFGQHRAMAVARGVVRHMSDAVPLHLTVAEELTAAGADPTEPARNLDSPDFPAPITDDTGPAAAVTA